MGSSPLPQPSHEVIERQLRPCGSAEPSTCLSKQTSDALPTQGVTCPEEKGKIVNELKSDFPDAKIQEKKGPHSYDKTGKSIADYTWFVMSDGNVSVSCTIWAGKFKERFIR